MDDNQISKKQEKRFLSLFFISSITILVLIILLNWTVDPRSEFGTNIFKPLIKQARAEKIDMLSSLDYKPELLIIGSSNAGKLNCSQIYYLMGEKCFNAAIDAARIEDYYAFLSYTIENLNITPKTLIIGLNIEAFNNNIETDPRLIAEKRLYSKIKKEGGKKLLPHEIKTAIDSLNPYYLLDTMSVIKYNIVGYPEESSYIESDGQTVYVRWDKEKESGFFNLQNELNNSMDAFIGRFKYMTNLSLERRQYLEKILYMAKINDIKIMMFMPAAHPLGIERAKKETQYAEMRELLTEYLMSLKEEYDFSYVDTSEIDYFDGEYDGFYDVYHVDAKNANLIILEMILQYNKEHPFKKINAYDNNFYDNNLLEKAEMK